MKKLIFMLGISLALTALLCSQEPEEQKRVVVGELAVSTEVRLSDEKARGKIIAKSQENEENLIKVEGQSSESKENDSRTTSNNMYYTTHPGVFHHAALLSFDDTLALESEDGAIWTVAPSDGYIVLNWFSQHLNDLTIEPTVAISLNHRWFSSYQFRITNQANGESVAANLYLGPFHKGLFTHWIIDIDYYNNIVYLEDGSVWNMSYFDDRIISKWLIDETVIILVNDGWLSSTRPNILLNVNRMTHAVGVASF